MSETLDPDNAYLLPEPIASRIVGKRILRFSIAKSPQTLASQVSFFTTGFEIVVCTSQAPMKVRYAHPEDEHYEGVFMSRSNFHAIDQALHDREGSEKKELNALFHKLWSRDNSEKYDKRDWKRLAEIISDAGL